jgi:hypothetical protein
VFEKQACQMATVNMTDINNDTVCMYSDTVVMVVKKKSTSLHNQLYNFKIKTKIRCTH